ncbi:protein TonB [Sphingomonas gellani]|uniref:Protein TonB n=1 Tax=Sphingomonas gellani TaxID=1166340 RepID=A0A1H7ZTE8_9SPHN|nr:hypothetical protein [Sphingomonas gellani]SEM61546.1 protein TonB [Sphingomonas gellani]
MRSAYLLPSPGDRSPSSRRAVSLGLTVAAHLLLVWLLLRMAPSLDTPPQAREQTSFEILPDRAEAPDTTRHAEQRRKARSAERPAQAAAPRSPAPPPPPVPTPAPATQPTEWAYMRENFDLGTVPKRSRSAEDGPTGSADTSASAGDGEGAVAVAGPGASAGGQRLYDADWYREPTDAQLSFYLRRRPPPGGWATIACRTVENYHVQDCRAIGESPVGLGLANAMTQAAWQFLVIPPRVGTRRLVGSWVRIRIDFTEDGASARR